MKLSAWLDLCELTLYRVHIHTGKHKSGCTNANQFFAVCKMAVYTMTHICIHIYCGAFSVYTQKRMWWCESIMLCCHRVTCEPWQGADGPGVPSFLLAMPFSLNTHTHKRMHIHTQTPLPSPLGFPSATSHSTGH